MLSVQEEPSPGSLLGDDFLSVVFGGSECSG
jgi:hypothetical protein